MTDLTPYVPRLVLDWQREAPLVSARVLDGPLLFIDLAGFTAMSERLATLGRQGAEEVVEIITATFTQLLGVAYSVDGTLLKFGGDALLLLFSGAQHERRAASAAARMRSTLRHIGTIRTPAGTVRLRMSAGMHSGVFHLFLVGRSHRELIIAGPGATTTVRMEQIATAGEILLSPASAAALPRDVLGQAKEDGMLLSRAPRTPAQHARAVDAEGLDVGVLVPKALREHLAGGGGEPEHRQVTVAFARFERFDAALEAHGTEATGRHLDELMAAVQDIVDEHEITFLATDVDADGGKIFLTAGAPRSFENNDERMLRALRQILALDSPFPLKAGVNRGPVFAADVGPPFRRTYSVMGDTVNTAARVMARAGERELLALGPVLEHSATCFATEELPPFTAKGKARPLVAYRVGTPLATASTSLDLASPFVGRADELRALTRAVSQPAAVVDVVGEAGIGKTRLVEEARHALAGTRALTIRCERYSSGTPYFAFRILLRSLLDLPARDDALDASQLRAAVEAVAPDLLDDLPILAAVFGVRVVGEPVEELDARFWRIRLQRGVARLLEAVVRERALVIFEDAQWIDEASAALARALASERAFPFPVVIVRRADGDAPFIADAQRVDLRRLADEHARRLLRALAPRPLLPAEESAVVARAEGNPMFLREIVASLPADATTDELPASLEAVLASRIDGLLPAHRTALRHLSVLGTSFTVEDAVAVVDDASSLDVVLGALSGFLDVRDDGVWFRNVLFHETAYQQLPYRLRRTLHQRAGEHIERRTQDPVAVAGVLSVHFHAARDIARSWRYSSIAARAAYAQHAFAESAQLYRRAVEAARALGTVDPVEFADVWRSYGDAVRYLGRTDEALRAYAEARKLVRHDPAATARLCFLEGDTRWRLGRYGEAMRWNLRGLRLLEGRGLDADERRDRVRLTLQCGVIRYHQGRYRESLRWAHAALMEAEEHEELAGIALACNCLHIAYSAMRDPAALEYGRRALALFEQLGSKQMQAQVLTNLAVDTRRLGRWHEALDMYARARAMLVEVGDLIAAAAVANNIGQILSDQGRLEEALAVFEEALTTFEAAKHWYRFVVKGSVGRVVVGRGEYEQAERLLDEARAGLSAMGATAPVREIEARHAELLLLSGRVEESLEQARALLAGSPGTEEPLLRRVEALALLGLGDREGASASLERGLAVARSLHNDLEVANALVLLARLEGMSTPIGEERMAEALEILLRLDVVAVEVGPALRIEPAVVGARGGS